LQAQFSKIEDADPAPDDQRMLDLLIYLKTL